MAVTTVAGGVVTLLRQSPALTALVPAGNVWGGEVPQEVVPPIVVVKGWQDRPTWVTESARIENHTLRVEIYTYAATSAGAANPAEAIANAVAAAIDWQEVGLADVQPIRFEETRRVRTIAKQLGPASERIGRLVMEYAISFGTSRP